MPYALPDLVSAPKVLPFQPQWIRRGHQFRLTSSLDIEGVTIEGFSLRAQCSVDYPEENVTFQLEYLYPGFRRGPVTRIEWRPNSPHNNKGLGPPHLHHILQEGTHFHPFELNWPLGIEKMVSQNLPIAVPLEEEPGDFGALTNLVGQAFAITNTDEIPLPSWQPRMI